MIKRLKSTFLLHINYLYDILSIIGVAWIVGMAIVGGVFIFKAPAPDTYANMGMYIAILVGVLTIIVVDFMFYAIYFNIAVSMGASRKRFLLESSLVLLAQHIIYAVFIFLLGKVELLIAKGIYKNVDFDKNVIKLDLNLILYLIGGSIAVIAISLFVGALLQRFGKTAFWIMWGAYMFFAFGGVGLTNLSSSNSNSFLGEILRNVGVFFHELTAMGMLTILAVLCTILAVAGVLIFRRASVK